MLSVYIVYELDLRPRNLLNTFTVNNYQFGAINIANNTNDDNNDNNSKSKYVYSGSGIVFGRKFTWGFGNDFPRSFIIFCVDDISSSHNYNLKNSFQCEVKK